MGGWRRCCRRDESYPEVERPGKSSASTVQHLRRERIGHGGHGVHGENCVATLCVTLCSLWLARPRNGFAKLVCERRICGDGRNFDCPTPPGQLCPADQHLSKASTYTQMVTRDPTATDRAPDSASERRTTVKRCNRRDDIPFFNPRSSTQSLTISARTLDGWNDSRNRARPMWFPF